MSGASIDLDILKDIPGYRGILKAVLRYQIQLLVEQLCKHGGEESVVLSVNVTEGTLSHLGTEAGKSFLTDNNEVRRQYLGYCLRNHQKRKSEFMSPSMSNENIQQSNFVSSKPESVLNYPVHKKPSYMVQRRNTRLRSGGKQFSPFYTKTGYNRPTLQKISTQSAYREKGKDVPQNQGQFSSEFIGRTESPRQQETLKTQYTGLRSNDEYHRADDIVVKTENATDDIGLKTEDTTDEKNSRDGILKIQNEREVTVKVEFPEEADETGNKALTEMSEDIQMLGGGRLGHHFSPNASMETEDSFLEGNQSFEYVLDRENSDNTISPWKPDETEKLSLFTSKRKQALPTRIKKPCEQINEKGDLSGQISQPQGSVWTQGQMLNLSGDEMAASSGSPYSEGAVDMSWGEENQQSGGSKTYMKTPQVVGLFVSRGEGRYEKLIQCEECGKVCRTSNMARHKKRYCSTLPSGSQIRKNLTHAIKEMPYGSPKTDVYLDNPEKERYSIGNFKTILPSQTKNFGNDSVEMESSVHNEGFINRRLDIGGRLISDNSSFEEDENLHKSISIKQEPANPDVI